MNNQGTFTKSGSAASSTISTTFNNTGTVNVQSGTLNLSGSGTDAGASYSGTGTIQFSGGTRTLDAASSITVANATFSGGTTTVNGTYNIAGTTTVSGGAATLAGTLSNLGNALIISSGSLGLNTSNASVATLTQSGGLLNGSGTLTVTGLSTLSGGTQSGSGTTIAQGGAAFTSTGFTVDGTRTLQLEGTSTATGTSVQIQLNGGSSPGSGILTIGNGATFNDQSTSSGLNILANNFGGTDNGGAAAVVNNQGTFTKSGSAASSTISTTFNNTGTVNVQSGTLTLAGPVINSGQLSASGGNITISGTLADGPTAALNIVNATIELAAVSGGTNVTFGGTSGQLKLDSAVSSAQSAGVSAASNGSSVTITGNGGITSTSADAIDVISSGGAISITPAAAITGALSGITIVQNGVGDITVTPSGPVVGQSGQGISVEETASGSGNIQINGSGSVTGTGNTNSGILAEILNAANSSNITVSQTGSISGGFDGIHAFTDGNGNVTVTTGVNATISGAQLFGIAAGSFGTGSVSVTTLASDTINSGSGGITAFNNTSLLPQSDASTIAVTAAGTINSGTAYTPANAPPGGIIAGYLGASSGSGTPNPAVFGNVLVNNSARINAAGGDGIRAYNFGSGNITINDLASTTITTLGRFGILASVFGGGTITISTATGDVINSASSGIQANDNGTTVAASLTPVVSVTALGTINSGYVTTGGVPSGISAGYSNNSSGITSSSIQGNVAVDSSATINAASGFGVSLFNLGVGSETVTLESSSAITAQAVGVNAFAQGGGSVSITNLGSVTVATGAGISTGSGNGPNSINGLISVSNSGTVSALGSSDKSVVQINNNSTQTAIFTNSGTVTSQMFSTNTQNQALAVFNGSVTVNNSGTITGNVNLATATFNNNSGGTWNVDGSNSFGNGANVIANAGTINISDVTLFTAAGTLAFENAGAVNLMPNSFAFIGGPVAGLNGTSGTFSIGNFSTLEFASSVAAGQTVSLGNGSLTIDSPATFNGTISGLQVGDTITFQGISITKATLSGSTLTITEAGQTLTYQLSGVPSGVTFSQLSADEIQLVPSTTTPVTGSLTSFSQSVTTQEFYIVSNATISGSGVGFGVTSSDATAGGFLNVEITSTPSQPSSISVSGTGNGVNLVTTAGDSIGLTNAGSVTSVSGSGINAIVQNSGAGSIFIVDYGNVSGGNRGINANTTGSGQINIAVEANATVTGTGNGTTNPGFAIGAFSNGGNIIVDTSPGDVLNSGSTGLNVQDQATSLSQASNSSISISAFGTINSGATPPSSGNEPGGIKTGYNGLGGANPQTTAVFGNIFVNNNANINAAGGMGIFAFNDGEGNIAITDNSGTTIIATAAGATTPGSAQYGIGAFGFEAGNTTVSMGFGSTINSGSSGIQAVNQATSTVSQPLTSSVTVVALGSINSGVNSGNSNAPPAGIVAGFFPLTGVSFDANVAGNVFVDFGGTIVAAAGDGIRAFNQGVGNVTVNIDGGASITATHSATAASDNAPYGVGAFTFGTGNIIVTTSSGDNITSGSSGIEATSQATAIAAGADAVIAVTNLATINSGTILTNISTEASGITAGFLGGTTATANPSVNGTVIVNNGGSIDAVFFGIDAFNFGTGDISVTNHGSISGGSAAIEAMPTSTSTATIDNFGVLMGEVIANNASFVNESGADWSIVGVADAFTGSSTLLNIGLVESNGTSSITGLSGTTNVGTIQVETGKLTIAGPVTGGGTAVIFGATMEFAAASDAHVQFDTGPAPAGTLLLDDVAHFTGTVTGVAGGDTIDLVGIAPASVSVSNSGGLHVNYGTGSFALGGNYDPAGFSVTPDGSGGTDITWTHQEPFIDTSHFTLINNGGTTTVAGLQVSDSDAGVTSVTISATTAQAASGSTVSPVSASGSLASINSTLATGVTYNPGATPPSQDMVTLTAVDNFGATDTVHFVFNNNSSLPLKGTPGNDVIFSSGGSDVLTGGGGADQFVFKPTTGTNPVQHVVTDFSAPIDTIDLRQFAGVSTSAPPSETQVGNDTLITIDSTDSVLLKSVLATSLHASNFILHS